MPQMTSVPQSLRLPGSSTIVLILVCCSALPAFLSEVVASISDSKCSLTPELVEGPYYLNDTLFRSNITEDQTGLALTLRVKVVDVSCNPLADTFVDIWSCNSTGFYSGYTTSHGPGPHSHDGPHHGPHGGPGHYHPHPPNGSHPWHHPNVTDDLVWLRGIVQTNDQGIAEFASLVPGWYPGRTAHIHIKVHVPYHSYTNESQGYEDSHVVHTGQFFFQEEFYQQITDLEPYTRDQHRRVHNEEDHDFQQDPTAVLEISNAGDSLGSGVIGTITAIVDPSATPTPVPMMDPSQMKHMDSDNFDDDEFNDDDEFDRGHGHKHAGHEHERKHQHGHGQAKQNTDMGPINIIRQWLSAAWASLTKH